MPDRETQMKALSSPPRLRILQLLARPRKHFGHQHSADPLKFGVCKSLIAEALGLSQPTVSRHVDLLRQAGFLTAHRHEKWSYCKRDDAALNEYIQWLQRDLKL